MINLKQALDLLESGQVVSLRVITANLDKKQGGKVLDIKQCKIARNQEKQLLEAQHSDAKSKKEKNPNHNSHFTRNIDLLNGQIRKIHPPLITHINSQAVL